MLALAALFHLVIMPAMGPGVTQETRDLYKPFTVDQKFQDDGACRAHAKDNLAQHLIEHGLPEGAIGNFVCTQFGN
ncbi:MULTISPECIES: hypothetical protein [unclassified Bradyrhizobium]|uniref:hypothetical protein n=1 Tax=unclassified Bradyrhizobium TaxID=2631580 RepID=UPI00070DD3D4|nr:MULTISPECIES: hypothetical protein [unclassified Bradyrhizobium]KQT21725.1 hypothetical protein ASG57_26745 [Bradyrhizobium sp. Leaf396]